VAGGRSGVADGFLSGVGDAGAATFAMLLLPRGPVIVLLLFPGAVTFAILLLPGFALELLMSLPPPRVISHAISTPDTASTTTIANTHGRLLLRDSTAPLLSGRATPRYCSGKDVRVDCAVGEAGRGLTTVGPGGGRFQVAFASGVDASRSSLAPSSRQNTSDSS
jgi:hypothetical protein